MPACSANASRTRWWCAVKLRGRVENAETTPMTAPTTFSGTHSIARIPSRLVHFAPRRAGIGLHVTDPDRHTLGGHASDDAVADRNRERPPLPALKTMGGCLDDLRPLAVEERDPAAGGPDQGRHREADAIEDRGHVEAGGDELARRVERRQLVGPPTALVSQPPLLDPQRQWTRELADHRDVGVLEGAGSIGGEHDRTEGLAARYQRDERDRPESAGRENPAAHLGNLLAIDIVDPYRSSVRHDAREQRSLERHPPLTRSRRRRATRRHVDELELTTLGVEERHREQIESHELRRARGESTEQIVDRVPCRQHTRDLGERRLATHPLLALAELLEGRRQLPG